MSDETSTTVSPIREKMRRAKGYRSERMDFPEWDGVEIEARSMTVGQVARFTKAAAGKKNAGKGIDQKTLEALKEGAYDPASGEPLFADNDLDFIRGLDPQPVNRLLTKILELSGLTDDEEEELGNE